MARVLAFPRVVLIVAALAVLGACEPAPVFEIDEPLLPEVGQIINEAAEEIDEPPVWAIANPYLDVDWESYGRYKANFHTHTTNSDGLAQPHAMVDAYHALGYSILAITDHDWVSYPWTQFATQEPNPNSLNPLVRAPRANPANIGYENRHPSQLDMVSIQGNELSMHHHMGSYFSGHEGTKTVAASLEAITAAGGLAVLFHPGRYGFSTEWYVNLYREHEHLIGLEIYNLGDRYPHDRRLWDAILTETMPDRAVWGFSNDDAHSLSQVGRNWNVMVLPELSLEWVRHGMEQGMSFFVYAPQGHAGPGAASIDSIRVDDRAGTIEIVAHGHESIRWISEGTIVSHEELIDLNDLKRPGVYVRAELRGQGGTVVGTQPFGIVPPVPESPPKVAVTVDNETAPADPVP